MTNQETQQEVQTTQEQATEEKVEYKGEVVTRIEENKYQVGSRQYELVANHRDGFDAQKFGERYSDVLAKYDYIVGDWGYEQLRLKGFFDENNKKALPEQRIDTLEDYLYEYCNFGCAYFVVKRIGGKREKIQNRKNKKHKNNQAFVEEKREVIAHKKKPTIKSRKTSENHKQEKHTISHVEGKRNFVVRKRED